MIPEKITLAASAFYRENPLWARSLSGNNDLIAAIHRGNIDVASLNPSKIFEAFLEAVKNSPTIPQNPEEVYFYHLHMHEGITSYVVYNPGIEEALYGGPITFEKGKILINGVVKGEAFTLASLFDE